MPTVLGSPSVSAGYVIDTKGYWMDDFENSNKMGNSSNIVMRDGEVKIIGPGFNFFFNSYEITPQKKKSWQSVDVSELIPRGSTGVILELVNTNKWRQLNVAVRMPGSSDPYQYGAIRQKGHIYALCGVDENRKFEAHIQTSDCHIFLVGYTDSAVNYFQNRIDKSLTTSDKWTDIDLSLDIPEDATGVIFQIINTKRNKLIGNNNRKASIRADGSTDDAGNTDVCEGGGRIYALCGINNRKIEGYIESGENGNLKHYLVGYTRYPIHFFQNQVDAEVKNANTWHTLDVNSKTSSNTNGLIFRICNPETKRLFTSHHAAIRKVDSIDDRKDNCQIVGDGHIWGIVGTDKYQQFEVKKGNTKIGFQLMGYSECVSSGYLYSKAIKPSTLKKWISFSWNDVESRNTNVKYQVEYYHSKTWSLIPDGDLPENSVGFDDSPVELTDLDVKKYNNIRLKATLSTVDTSVTPKVKDWGVTWQTAENEWKDYFSTNYRVKSAENICVENSDVTLGINHSDWSTYGGNDHRTGISELDYGPTTNNVLWKANVTGTWDCYAGASIHDGVVYVVGKDWKTGEDKQGNLRHRPGHAYTFALDAATGEKIWMYPTGSVDDNPVYYDGMIFVQSSRYRRSMSDYSGGYDRLWCLDAVDGSLIWMYLQDACTTDDFNSMCGTPTIAEDKNLVMSLNNNFLYAVNITTGKGAWSVRLPNAKNTPTAPTYFNGVVYAGCEIKDKYGDWLYAYEVYEDHVKLKWAAGGTNKRLGSGGIHDSSPTIYNYNGEDRLYIGCMDGNIHELDLSNGNILRTYDTGDNIYKTILGTPAIHDDVLFAGGMDGYMYAIKLSDFSLKWERKCGENTIKEKIRGIIKPKKAWQDFAIFSTAAIANGIVYYGSQDDKVYAVSEENGELIWSYKTGNGLYGQAAISDGILYITSDDWYLYAFGPASGPTYKYCSSGNVTSTKIKKSNSMQWDKFYTSDTIPHGTSITYKILDENNNVICTVEDGDNISSISQNTIMLTASLETTNPQKTPILHDWKITTTPVEIPWFIIVVVSICIAIVVLAAYGMTKFLRHKKK